MTCADNPGVATNCHPNTATTGQLGVVQPDGTTITISGGVISSTGGGGGCSVPLTGWTLQNATSPGAMFNNFLCPPMFTQVATGPIAWQLVTQPIPGATYTVVVTLNMRPPDVFVNSVVMGLFLFDGTQAEDIESVFDTAANIVTNVRTIPTLSSSGSITSGPGSSLTASQATFKVQDNGTNRIWSVYNNGAFTVFLTEPSNSFLTPTAFGVGGLCNGSVNAACDMQILSLTATTP
jgi:hypothetical protein